MAYTRPYQLSADRSRLYSYGVPDVVLTAPPPPPAGALVRTTRVRGFATATPTGSGRDLLVPGTYKPDATNTGYLSGTTFTEIGTSAQVIYSSINPAGSPLVVSNVMFTCKVVVTGTNITFKNCWFRGWPLTTGDCIDTKGAPQGANIVFEDCTVQPQSPGWASNGIRGWQFTCRRVRGLNTTDFIAHQGGDYNADQGINVIASYISDFAYNSPCPDAAGGMTDNAQHTDELQYRGGTGIYFFGNTIKALIDPAVGQGGDLLPVRLAINSTTTYHLAGNKYKTPTYAALPITSALMGTPILGTTFGGITYDTNWMDGGAVIFNFAGRTTAEAPIIIRNNKWGRSMRLGDQFTILAPASLPITISGNTYEDTGAAANQRNNG